MRLTSKRFVESSSHSSPSSFYITTPIFYVNGDPHLGHAYSLIVADTLARFHRNLGDNVHFLTGTDEYGQKIEQSAKLLNKSPIDFATENSQRFRELADSLYCLHDDFIRTTEQRHINTVVNVWNTLKSKNQLYQGTYEGWYSIRDETFYTEKELINGKAPTGADVVWLKEQVYFFRLTHWRDQLIEHYTSNKDSIYPEYCKSEILHILSSQDDFTDICVSRRNFSWGIPVPNSLNDPQVIYVWLDALTNYISALGYDPTNHLNQNNNTSSAAYLMNTFWPANIHIVGKDILRFHALFWPAVLLALNLPLPRTIISHGWWTKDGVKMSKSIGNVVEPFQLIKEYGSDALRYFLLSEVSLGSDGDFNFDNFITRINSHLSDNLGNLVQRVLSMIHKHCDQSLIPSPSTPFQVADENLLNESITTLQLCQEFMNSNQIHKSLEVIFRFSRSCNKYIDNETPWKLKKSNITRMNTVLYVLLESIRRLSILLNPFLPNASNLILDQMQVPSQMRTLDSFQLMISPGSVIHPPSPIFPKHVGKSK